VRIRLDGPVRGISCPVWPAGGRTLHAGVSSLPKVLRQITGVFLVAAQVLLAEVQLVYHCIFGDFMPVSQIGMGGNVVVNFNS
jgi:hypothetical protein